MLTGDNAGDTGGEVDSGAGSGLDRAEPVSPLGSAPRLFDVGLVRAMFPLPVYGEVLML